MESKPGPREEDPLALLPPGIMEEFNAIMAAIGVGQATSSSSSAPGEVVPMETEGGEQERKQNKKHHGTWLSCHDRL